MNISQLIRYFLILNFLCIKNNIIVYKLTKPINERFFNVLLVNKNVLQKRFSWVVLVDSCKNQANSQWFGQIKDLHPKLEASVTRVKRLLHITCLLDFSKAPHERNSQSSELQRKWKKLSRLVIFSCHLLIFRYIFPHIRVENIKKSSLPHPHRCPKKATILHPNGHTIQSYKFY